MARKQVIKEFSFNPDQIWDASIPPVLEAHRDRAWEVYQALPFPGAKDEAWRRTSLTGLDFGALQLPNGKQGDLPSGIIPDQVLASASRARLGSAGVEIQEGKELREKGVIFSSLEEAAANHPDLVEKVLGKVVSPEDGKFAAAAGAFGRQGLFIYVPRGVQVETPLYSICTAPDDGRAFFFQTLIYLEEGAGLTYFQETNSAGNPDLPALVGENLEIYLDQNAFLKIVELQNYGPSVWSFGHKKARVERDGTLEWEIGALGSALCKHFIALDLEGEGAEGRVSGLFFADQNQHLTYNTLQRHLAPRTNSDLLFKGALNGSSRSVWRGMIYVAPGARYIDGYQANRNLVLDPAARSDSIPGLEILNNDVRCTHGSTVGKIDPEQLFYLRSRGIPLAEAEQLVIEGFFGDVIARFSNPEVGEELWARIKKRLLG